ncbi:hypothetical protein JOB18_035097 [Solea senegalensis]|uniref:Uncharacterized protein n=1 Tax=Solea senegalensis TaxID=28829 RepID=A0AAV6PJF9_SOLSE|nr:hypothetical protein JOB18_035097 [Solea senegalensis]
MEMEQIFFFMEWFLSVFLSSRSSSSWTDSSLCSSAADLLLHGLVPLCVPQQQISLHGVVFCGSSLCSSAADLLLHGVVPLCVPQQQIFFFMDWFLSVFLSSRSSSSWTDSSLCSSAADLLLHGLIPLCVPQQQIFFFMDWFLSVFLSSRSSSSWSGSSLCSSAADITEDHVVQTPSASLDRGCIFSDGGSRSHCDKVKSHRFSRFDKNLL